jgi:general secretion pathway protein D
MMTMLTPRLPSRAWLAATLAAALALSPPLAAQVIPQGQPVTLNFVNADIEAVSRAIGAMINRQLIVDPRVRGQITVYSERAIPVAEAYRNYLAALRGLGFTVVENAGLLKVVPEADAKLQAGIVSVDGVARRGDQVLTQIFRLNHENPNNLVAILRPLISPNNTINASPGNSSLVITDYADNLQRIARIIAALDQPTTTDVEIIPLKHAVASDMAALVQRLSDAPTAGVVPGVPQIAGGAGQTSVLADPRSNSLIVRAASPARLQQIRLNVAKLDVPNPQGSGPGGNIWVVYLKNADATKLAQVLRAAFASGASSAGGGGAATGSISTTTQQAIPAPGTQPGGATQTTVATTPVAASAQPSTGGFIQADPSTNSLIITAAEPLYRQIRGVIDQLDTRRAQIFVESMIVKVDANKAAEFGFQWQHLFGDKGDTTLTGIGTNFGAGAGNILNLSAATAQGRSGVAGVLGSVAALNGMNIGVLKKVSDFYTLGAIARFLETNTGANILSTPNLIALDNEEAKIVIGQNVPFVTGSFTNTGANTGNLNPFQTIERKDVGLTLRVKSQVGEGGTVRMTIYQENSSVVPGSTTNAGPVTDKSAIETTVVVDDGAIMVLGGLLKDEYTDSDNRVPGLGSIPLVGHLFRSENRTRIKSNLMVFLRPVVVRDGRAADSLTIDRYEAIRALQKDGQPQPSWVVPVNEAPVLAPQVAPPASGVVPAPLKPVN